jgi:hypothetical protein
MKLNAIGVILNAVGFACLVVMVIALVQGVDHTGPMAAAALNFALAANNRGPRS